MSTIVITGGRGYIGSALARRLASEGHALRLVSRAAGATGASEILGPRLETVTADLRDQNAWTSLLSGVDAVVHLSWRTDLYAAEVDPAGDYSINVEPIRALIRAARRASVPPVVVFASTVTIAGINPHTPVNERTPDDPCSVYDRHKLACEHLLREATIEGIMRACTLRLSNIYGYGTASINANRGILNAMMKRAAQGEPLTLFGDGNYVRDFIHLDDVVDAFCRAVATPAACDGSHYVIATGEGHSIADAFSLVAAEANAFTGSSVELRRIAEPVNLQPIERRNFVGDSRLYQARTEWLPHVDLATGVRDYFKRALASPAVAVG